MISSHILSEVSQICEKVIIIDKGEIVAIDTPENLEGKTAETESLTVVVEDTNNKFESIKEEIEAIKEIKLVKENEDATKEYRVEITSDSVRKEMFTVCAKNEITILEMKKNESSLEDAFIKLVENRPEYSQKEIKKMQYEKEIEELREEERIKKENRANRKQAIKEEKARKKAKREAKKAEKEAKKADKKEKKQAKKAEVASEKPEEVKEEVKKEEGGDK